MLDYKNVNIKRYALNLRYRKLDEEFGASWFGVNDFFRVFEKCDKLSYLFPQGITNSAVMVLVYGHALGSNSRTLDYYQPDFEGVFQQRKNRKNMAQVYLWNRHKMGRNEYSRAVKPSIR